MPVNAEVGVVAGSSGEGSGLGDLLAPIRSNIVAACVVQAVAAIAGLVPFIAVAEIGRELLADGPADDRRLWTIAIVATVGLIARLGLLFGAAAITHFADNELQLVLRRRIADRLGRAPLGWFDGRDGGDIKKAVVDDVGSMHHLVGHTFTDLTAAIVTPIIGLGYLFTIDWQMTLVLLIPFGLGLFLYSRQMVGYAEKMAAYDQALEDVNVGSVEFVQGISVVKTFGQAGRAHRSFIDAAHRFVDFFWTWVSGLIRTASLAEVVLSPLTTLAVIGGTGTWFVSNGWISTVDLVSFFLLGLVLTAPILALGYAMTDVQNASAAAARVGALLDTPVLLEPDSPQAPNGHRIEFDNVSYSYDGERIVLDGIDLVLEPGTITAVVGPSGSGKSTLAKMLCRFWDPTGGTVRLGGIDLRDVGSAELYRHVGFVFQDVQLLGTSIADNIALARPDAAHDEIEQAARAAQIHERITRLPHGYDSMIGDVTLSGGEAQRVSIARAILADAPVLVLDEATAFADPESEASIQAALSVLVAGKTVLVIAHRLSTIVGADQIVVVDDGRLVQQGTHDQLVDIDGEYQRQWFADRRAQPAVASGVAAEVQS